MIPLLYQKFVIYMNYEDYNKEYNINYTNYKLVLLVDNMKKVKEKYQNAFIEYCLITNSINETILKHCEKIKPNTLILITNFLKDDMLITLNNEFLMHQKFICNNKICEKKFKHPIYWSCKANILHQIKNQVQSNKQNELELSLNALDILDGKQYELELFESYNLFDINTINKEKRIKCKKINYCLHIILATYNRNQYMHKVIDSLENQKNKNIHLHVLYNNTDKNVQKELDNILNSHKKIKITLHRYGVNYHCISRIFLIKKLLNTFLMDYVVIFDDDQIHYPFWTEQLLKLCKPLSTLSWYGKIFDNIDYWNNGADKEKILKYADIEYKKKDHIDKFKYFGPGGCIFDVNLFYFNEIFDYNKYYNNIYKIDDIWLSFIFDKYLNISLNRMMYHPLECADRNDNIKTWTTVKDEKNQLFKNFHNTYKWNIIKPSRHFLTFNNCFDCIYVLYSSNSSLLTLKKQFKKMNICACYVYIENNVHDTKINVFFDSFNKKYNSIAVFQENIVFHQYSHFYFDNIMNVVPKDWKILYLGNDEENLKSGSYEVNNDINSTYAVAYSSSAIEEILAFYINNKNLLIENRIILLTNIREQYIFTPSIIKSKNYEVENYEFKNYINTHINVFLFYENPIPKFYYSNYTIKSIKEISNSSYFVIINNKNIQLNPDILGIGVYELMNSGKSHYYPTSFVTYGNDCLHGSLIYDTNVNQKQIGFFTPGNNVNEILKYMNK